MSFSGDFVGRLQDNQRFRYNEVMDAFNMSAALTARKTKEFRSPPQEQVRGQRLIGLDCMFQSLLLASFQTCMTRVCLEVTSESVDFV